MDPSEPPLADAAEEITPDDDIAKARDTGDAPLLEVDFSSLAVVNEPMPATGHLNSGLFSWNIEASLPMPEASSFTDKV